MNGAAFTVGPEQATDGLDSARFDLMSIWGASPPYGNSSTVVHLLSDGALAGYDGSLADGGRFAVLQRRPARAVGGGAAAHCVPSPALLRLPLPGDKMTGEAGAVQSLSANKALVVGRPYVTHVSGVNARGTYGFNGGQGAVAYAVNSPDSLDIRVHFSEPVVVSCGVLNDLWNMTEQFPGISYFVCPLIKLVLITNDNSSLVSSPNSNTLGGTLGTYASPTSFLTPLEGDAATVLNFRYLVRRGDNTSSLQYANTFALTVTGGATIARVADNVLASIRLPPTRHDAGLCVPATNAKGTVLCASPTADHLYSLAGGQSKYAIDAAF